MLLFRIKPEVPVIWTKLGNSDIYSWHPSCPCWAFHKKPNTNWSGPSLLKIIITDPQSHKLQPFQINFLLGTHRHPPDHLFISSSTEANLFFILRTEKIHTSFFMTEEFPNDQLSLLCFLLGVATAEPVNGFTKILNCAEAISCHRFCHFFCQLYTYDGSSHAFHCFLALIVLTTPVRTSNKHNTCWWTI